MSTQENANVANAAFSGNCSNPPLVEVTSQLSPVPNDSVPVSNANSGKKPQVVFVEQRRQTHTIEIHVGAKPQTDAVPDAAPPEPATEDLAAMPFVQPLAANDTETDGRFAVDPFVYEIDGAIPVMPTLPIVESKTSTDQVVAREQPGEHFAWRLMPGPYPAEGNIAQVPTDNATTDEQLPLAMPNPLAMPKPIATDAWTETEVVAENGTAEREDCFFAQPGDVIAIDGNKGFDHIDLRSYSIDNATFQPGAILLHSEVVTAESGEGELLPAPITIRHRGVQFAVFSGEVRVDL